jgi:endonuclease YncB( thermonuclease family)
MLTLRSREGTPPRQAVQLMRRRLTVRSVSVNERLFLANERRRTAWPIAGLALVAFLAVTWLDPIAARGGEGPVTRLWGTVRSMPTGTHLVVVSPDQGSFEVRLFGVVLPEPPRAGATGAVLAGQPFGAQAERYARDLLLEKQVSLDAYGKDRAGRRLAVVWLGEINVNLTLVKEGLAWVDPSLTVTNVRAPLEVAERQARVGRYGLWSLPDPEPPWEYRKRYRLASE